jgi:HAD superfamily hydrolase (TIGR01509 family)
MSVAVKYFAYASNMSTEAIVAACPSHRFLGAVRLPRHRLAFTRRSVITRTGVADVVGDADHDVWGALYSIAAADLERLDRKEGRGFAYERYEVFVLAADGTRHAALAYSVLAKEAEEVAPSPEYLRLMLDGARERALPVPYLLFLKDLARAWSGSGAPILPATSETSPPSAASAGRPSAASAGRPRTTSAWGGVEAVIFDLDGVLLESEQVWIAAKRELTEREGGTWTAAAEHDMLGMSSTEWSRYMRERLHLPLSPARISQAVVELLATRYRAELPLIPGADRAVRLLAARWPLGLASSSNRETIDLVLALTGWDALFSASVSSEQVGRGKPAPDVYLEAARQLAAEPAASVAVEASDAGIRSAAAAGLAVLAIPNRAFPPAPQALRQAQRVLSAVDELDEGAILAAAAAAAAAHSVRQVSSSE